MSICPLSIMRWGAPSASRTCVALHGITANAGAFTQPARRLAARGWQVVAPDMRGHGESSRGNGDFSFASLLGDIVAAVPPEPDLLIGHSFGGTLAQLAVLQGLIRPKALVLEDPVSFFADKETPAAMLAWDRQNLSSDVVALLALNPGWARRDAAWKLLSLEQIDFEDAAKAFAGNAPWDLRPEATTLAATQPTLWILPIESRFVPAADQDRLRAEVGDKAVVSLPDVGHSVHRDVPEAFVDIVMALADGRWFTEPAAGQS